MGRDGALGDPRRRRLLAALAAGAFSVGSRRATAFFHTRKSPHKLAEGQSIYELQGSVLVNGNPASAESVIRAGDRITTGADSQAIFVIGEDAFLLRASSRLETGGDGFLVGRLRLLTGKLLSVFGRARHRVETPLASVGIRGTGLYVESDSERTYVCTCYGVTELASRADPLSREIIESGHHDEPRYILSTGAAGTRIRPAPVINHTDEELTLIEALVGRVPPFVTNPGRYQRGQQGDDR